LTTGTRLALVVSLLGDVFFPTSVSVSVDYAPGFVFGLISLMFPNIGITAEPKRIGCLMFPPKNHQTIDWFPMFKMMFYWWKYDVPYLLGIRSKNQYVNYHIGSILTFSD